MNEFLTYGIFWPIRILAWASLFVSGFRLGLASRYPLIYVYIVSSAFAQALAPVAGAFFGYDDIGYAAFYTVFSLLEVGLVSAILLKIYRLLGPVTRSGWHLLAVPALLAGIGFLELSQGWVVFRLLEVAYACLAYLGIATMLRMVRRREVVLGWNWTMTLLALTVPLTLSSIVFVTYESGACSRDLMVLWLEGAGSGGWIIMALGLREFSPPWRKR